jgi:arylsulfatase A-like enzyme
MKPNILFLLLDSLRGDKCYGERKSAITPNIDKLIKNGIYFSQTIGSSNFSLHQMSKSLSVDSA